MTTQLTTLPNGLRYLTTASVPGLFDFPADMQRVASYILTLHSTNPPNAKAVQGEPCEGQAMVADSTKAM